MNPEFPGNERDQLEASITALLLGELSPDQAAALEQRLAKDPELGQLHAKLKASLELVREATRKAPGDPRQPTLRLSEARRQRLLKEFRTVKMSPVTKMTQWEASWLVPVGLAAVFTVVAAGLMLPALSKAKNKSVALARLEPLRTEFRRAGGQMVAGKPEGLERLSDGLSAINGSAPSQNSLVQLQNAPAASRDLPAITTTTPAEPGAAFAVPVEPMAKGKEIARVEIQLPKTAAETTEAIPAPTDVEARTRFMSRSGGRPSASPAPERGRAAPAAEPATVAVGGVVLYSQAGEAPKPAAQEAEALARADSMSGRVNSAITQPAAPASAAGIVRGLYEQSAGKRDSASEGKLGLAEVPVLGDTPMLGRAFKPNSGMGGFGGGAAGPGQAGAFAAKGTELAQKTEALLDSKAANRFSRERQLSEQDSSKQWGDFDNNGSLDLYAGTRLAIEGRPQEKLVERYEWAGRSLTNQALGYYFSVQDPSAAAASVANDKSGALSSNSDRGKVLEEVRKKVLEVQPEIQTRENPFSTFSLNVSDVSFKLAAASLESGKLPDAASIRTEEFVNAFDYRDPAPAPGAPVGFVWERAAYPFAHNRDLLRLAIKTAAQGRAPGQALNLTLLLDNSGSMERADRVRIIREALRVLGTQLRPEDRLSVVTFARRAVLKTDGVPGNNAPQVLEEVSRLTPEGGTNLEEAMRVAYETALRHYQAGGNNRVVLLTDGAANLGDVRPEALKRSVESHRKQGIALDCFGIGWEGYNDDLLEVLSRNGDGRYGFINSPEAAASDFAAQLAGALQVAASDVKVQVEFNPARVTAYRQIGYAKHQLTKEQFRDNTVDAAEIGAAESGNALYVLEVNPGGAGAIGSVRVRYKVPGTAFYHEHEWAIPYTGSAAALDRAAPSMRLAATAGAFSEWLAGSPYAADVSSARLQDLLRGIPEQWGADSRPNRLETMIQQAQRISGK